VYFGDLGDVVRHAHAALRPGGWLVFSVEALPEHEPADWRLLPTGRYAHRGAPLARQLADAGFSDLTLEAETLRFEGGKPVAGWLVSARRPLGAS
jgi:predicted TPR repeat methyltransferase